MKTLVGMCITTPLELIHVHPHVCARYEQNRGPLIRTWPHSTARGQKLHRVPLLPKGLYNWVCFLQSICPFLCVGIWYINKESVACTLKLMVNWMFHILFLKLCLKTEANLRTKQNNIYHNLSYYTRSCIMFHDVHASMNHTAQE